ncbi:MAG: sugar phosphate isomerase/epimerase [Planctomycetota bacterium]|nr:sugar phosphate isomerase/epimerase [Planctomycetota bacterium]
MKASISAWSYRYFFEQKKMDYLAFVDEVKRLGADGLEIFPNYVDASDPGGHLKKIARKAARLGLEISSVIAANDFARPTAQERAEQVERFKQWISYTAEAGVERINCFTGCHTSGQDPMTEAFRVIDSYREVVPQAERHEIILCIENHSSVCPDADGILGIIRAVGSTCLRTNPDPTNFLPDYADRGEEARERIYGETEKFAALMANAHLKVSRFARNGEHAYVSAKRLLDIFRKSGFDGHVVLEADRDPEKAPEICAKGLALLRKHM